uniref:Uncharacterized protein n=1 Tax=Rhizophora mucronata TaxID=61149 RepID=A0A2P2P880_RHIMU
MCMLTQMKARNMEEILLLQKIFIICNIIFHPYGILMTKLTN